MIYPEFITKGDTVYVTAPSDGNKDDVDYIRLDRAKAALRERGVETIETPDVRKSEKGRSAAAKQRADEFTEAWFSGAKAVFAAKGGDFLMEMLTFVPFDRLCREPKWFQGFSDNTSIGFILSTCYDIASIYGDNFNTFAMEDWHRSVSDNWRILCGETVTQYSFDRYQDGWVNHETGREGYELTTPVEWKCINESGPVTVAGRLTGGCLDVLLNLAGTKYDRVKEYVKRYRRDGILWFIESFSLGGGDIERGLWQLGEAGWFENVKGFVFGRPAFFTPEYDVTYEEALMNGLGKYNVPIIAGADIGHKPPQFTVVNGAYGILTCMDGKGSLDMKFI